MLKRLTQKRSEQRWSDAAEEAKTTDLNTLRALRGEARALRSKLDKVLFTAQERLSLPMIGTDRFPKPHNCDWSWRPELWRGPLNRPGIASARNRDMLGPEVTIFHDCRQSELTVRQLRNRREKDLAAFGLRMDVFRFEGSFLSVSLDLPQDAADGLRKNHVFCMNSIIEMEKPIEIFVRLNIQNGPNTEQIVREMTAEKTDMSAEFDLAYSNLNEKRVDKAWVDIIFEGPQMNQVVLRDLTFMRWPRADL